VPTPDSNRRLVHNLACRLDVPTQFLIRSVRRRNGKHLTGNPSIGSHAESAALLLEELKQRGRERDSAEGRR
jgi:hypothetical protein